MKDKRAALERADEAGRGGRDAVDEPVGGDGGLAMDIAGNGGAGRGSGAGSAAGRGGSGAGSAAGSGGSAANTRVGWSCMNVFESCACLEVPGASGRCDTTRRCCFELTMVGLKTCQCWPDDSESCRDLRAGNPEKKAISACPP